MLNGHCNHFQMCYHRDRSKKFPSVPRNEFIHGPGIKSTGRPKAIKQIVNRQSDEKLRAFRLMRAVV
jgi:hypothetical protein